MTATPDVTELAISPHYAAARRRVTRQLIESLCVEGLVAIKWRDDGGEFVGELAAGSVSYTLRVRRRSAFGRLTLVAALRQGGGEPGPAEVLRDLADVLPATPDHLVAFTDELERTVVNDALARRHGTGDHDGHPSHPSFKSRVGFDLADNLAFGPEFGSVVAPRWLAVDRALTAVTPSGHVDVCDLLAAELGDQLGRFDTRLSERGRSLGDMALLPVHPWQWRERLAPRLAALVDSSRVVDLGAADAAYRPRASIRTLGNTDHPHRCDLKLALGITNTSTARTLAPHTVANAAPVSDWLHDVATSDPALTRLVVVREVLGVSVDGCGGHLAAVWRQSLAPQLELSEAAVSFTRLAAPGGPLDPAVRARLARDGAEPWVRQLLEVALVPLVHLLVGHGIAVEAHAQNLLLVHEDGWPARLAVQDLHDGIRFSRDHLTAPTAAPPLTPTPEAHVAANRNSYLETDAADDVRDFLLDALLCVNLSELAIALHDQELLPEAEFWRLARERLAAHRRRHPELVARYDTFGVLAPTLRVEQLTARRLLPESERRVREVANPLAGADRPPSRRC